MLEAIVLSQRKQVQLGVKVTSDLYQLVKRFHQRWNQLKRTVDERRVAIQTAQIKYDPANLSTSGGWSLVSDLTRFLSFVFHVLYGMLWSLECMFYRMLWSLKYMFYGMLWSLECMFYRMLWSLEYMFYGMLWSLECMFYGMLWSLEYMFYRMLWSLEYMFYGMLWSLEYTYFHLPSLASTRIELNPTCS